VVVHWLWNSVLVPEQFRFVLQYKGHLYRFDDNVKVYLKQDVGVWIGFILLMTGSIGGFLWTW
jgi:hypothetical protein